MVAHDDANFIYNCEAEVSRNGNNFSNVGTIVKKIEDNDSYQLSYTGLPGKAGCIISV